MCTDTNTKFILKRGFILNKGDIELFRWIAHSEKRVCFDLVFLSRRGSGAASRWVKRDKLFVNLIDIFGSCTSDHKIFQTFFFDSYFQTFLYHVFAKIINNTHFKSYCSCDIWKIGFILLKQAYYMLPPLQAFEFLIAAGNRQSPRITRNKWCSRLIPYNLSRHVSAMKSAFVISEIYRMSKLSKDWKSWWRLKSRYRSLKTFPRACVFGP